MADPLTIASITLLIAKNAPGWISALRTTVLDEGKGILLDKSKEFVVGKSTAYGKKLLRLDEKEQQRHMEQALKNAIERGSAAFQDPQEQQQYRQVLKILCEAGSYSESLRKEALRLLTLSETLDLAALNNIYNEAIRKRTPLEQPLPPALDAAPYLQSFFNALISELYADPYFKQQMSEALQQRALQHTRKSLDELLSTLKRIDENLAKDYTVEQLERDMYRYAEHITRTLHTLKIVGVVPKDRDKNRDPELNGIFVPLRIEKQGQDASADGDEKPRADALMQELDRHPYMVLLGGPGSGKSTAIKYLAWSHAAANLDDAQEQVSLLHGKPLPLRIELRRLSADRRQHPAYNFLSYATEVLLGHEGLHIDQRMFEQLLERRAMLLLFDGLDEVATLAERNQLVEEIEHFALRYPGNRIVITSRPVGYDLTRFGDEWFTHREVLPFNDVQIQTFLERWYRHVLRLDPLPAEDREEMELLQGALKENQRLHKLAENPLLLTVITALHRYERLPDRRVQIYDRCADLLLETWARLRGTHMRWQHMKLCKEDQYACVAHLGFVLHQRSQEQETEQDEEEQKQETASDNDVPARFIQREIEKFIKGQQLISEVGEQHAEAKRFLQLMQEEAGLIVERGTDENGEALYGFVHRTFQEYFAAIDVYERYQQKEAPKIIKDFLKEHLHDPHWEEVILLLLGKLKRQPVTAVLRQILEGKLKSRRSAYTNILQQDLFFVCECLCEEIVVDQVFAQEVGKKLRHLITSSPINEQRKASFAYLGRLAKTQQYGNMAWDEVWTLAGQYKTLSLRDQNRAAWLLLEHSTNDAERRKQALQVVERLGHNHSNPLKGVLDLMYQLYIYSQDTSGPEATLAKALMDDVLQRQDFTAPELFDWIEQHALYLPDICFWAFDSDSTSPVEQQKNEKLKAMALILFLKIFKQPEHSTKQLIEMATLIIRLSLHDSSEEEYAWYTLANLYQRDDISVFDSFYAAMALFKNSSRRDRKWQAEAIRAMITLLQSEKLTPRDLVDIASNYYWGNNFAAPEVPKLLEQRLWQFLERQDLSIHDTIQITAALYSMTYNADLEHSRAAQELLKLLQHLDLALQEKLFIIDTLEHAEDDIEKITHCVIMELLNKQDFSLQEQKMLAKELSEYGSLTVEEKARLKRFIAQIPILQDSQRTPEMIGDYIVFLLSMGGFSHLAEFLKKSMVQEQAELIREHLRNAVWEVPFIHLGQVPVAFVCMQSPVLPEYDQDKLYERLGRVVPRFHRLTSEKSVAIDI